MKFKTGQKVSWKIRDFKLVGVVVQELEDKTIEVLIHTRNEVPYMQKVNVEKELLTKIN